METKDVTVKQFTKLFNAAVKRFKAQKCESMEFVPYLDGEPHEQWFAGVLNTVHMRGVVLHPIERYGYTVGILFLRKPHSKFTQLMSWLDKYGHKNFNVNHIESKLYVADVCGKRGRWSTEDECRKDYLCHNDKWCEKVKKSLQEMRNTGDNIEVSRETVEHFENMEESIRNETELYGCVLHTLHFKVTAPGGKVKFDSVIY